MQFSVMMLAALLLSLRFYGVSSASLQNQRYSLILFSAEQDSIWTDIFVMSPDGSNLLNLTNTPEVSELGPVWSPDGTRIAYRELTPGLLGEIMVTDGRTHTNISQNDALDAVPAWSPDGRRIAYVSNQNGDYDIFMAEADGSRRRNLTNHPAYDSYPAWSPDGRHIVFTSDRDRDADLFVMNADGTNPVNLTSDEPYQALADWSPDGKWVAYTQNDPGQDGDVDLYLFGWPETSRVRLTDWEDSAESSPSWSPDGRRLAYVSFDNELGTGATEIFVLDIENPDAPVQITDNEVGDFGPDWSPWLDDYAFYNAFLSPTTLTCPSAPPSRLHIGSSAYVAVPIEVGDVRRDLRLRAEPGGEPIGSMSPGQDFAITGNPECGDDGLMWWPVTTLDGMLSGWSVEGFAPDDYLMVPHSED